MITTGKTVAQLAAVAMRCGLPTSGSKAAIESRITEHFSQFHRPLHNDTLLSLDLGYANIAWTILGPQNEIMAWRRSELCSSLRDSHEAPLFVDAITDFITTIPLKEFNVSQCVMERQRYFTSSIARIPESVLRCNVVEVLMHALLRHEFAARLGHSKSDIISVSPVSVAAYISPYITKLSAFIKKKSKKTQFVELSRLILQSSIVKCSDELEAQFKQEKKKDDLADSLLQALVWRDWQYFSFCTANSLTAPPILFDALLDEAAVWAKKPK